MAPKRKSGDAGNLDTPKRSRKVLSLIEKVWAYRKNVAYTM